MNFGDKLIRERKKMGISQEQLAEKLGVTRQSVSKWELSSSVPEITKLIQLSNLFGVSIDYLVKDEMQEEIAAKESKVDNSEILSELQALNKQLNENKLSGYHYTSKRKIAGIPLVDIHLSNGLKTNSKEGVAKGIIAIGNVAVGLLSIGLTSFGVISLGLVSIGLLAIGLVAIGILALGSVSIGVIATGFVALGIYATGFCVVAKELGIGYTVSAKVAIGTEIDGKHLLKVYEELRPEEIRAFLDTNCPSLPKWLTYMISNGIGK